MFSRNPHHGHHDVPRHYRRDRFFGSDLSSADSLGGGLRCSRGEGFEGLFGGGRMSPEGLGFGGGSTDEGPMFHHRRGSMGGPIGGLMSGMDGLRLSGGPCRGRPGGSLLGRRMGSQPGSPLLGRGSGSLGGRGMMDPRCSMFERPDLGLDRGFGPRGRLGGVGGLERGPMMTTGLGDGGIGGGVLRGDSRGRHRSADSFHSIGNQCRHGHLDRQPRVYHYQPPFVDDEIDEEMLMHEHMMAMDMIPEEYYDGPFFRDPRAGGVI